MFCNFAAIMRMLLAGGLLLIEVGCQQPRPSSPPTQAFDSLGLGLDSWRQLGDSLTMERQRAILQKLLQIAEREGWGGAVRYCHAAAETLTTYRQGGIFLKRVALKNRNPKNALQDSLDKAAYSFFSQTRKQESFVQEVQAGHFRYYRPIYIGMPQCLKCHGQSGDLDGLAWAEIRKRYPGDKATGFSLGDLRGLWRMDIKIEGK